MRLSVRPVTLRFRVPLRTAYGTLRERPLLAVEVAGPDGEVGVGEAAPLEAYDGVPLDRARAEVESCRRLLEAAGPSDREELLDACRARVELPQALAAIDLALWDLAGKLEGRPLSRLLAADPAAEVPVNATLAATDPAGAAAEAEAAVRAGFRCVKLKVGMGGDAARVIAVREAVGPGVAIRVDANGAWTVGEAEAALRELARAGIELCEEPVHGADGLRMVRERAPEGVVVAMDETAAEPDARASGACHAVCLKIASCGGVSGLMAAADVVGRSGAEVYLASTFDGPAGIAAALHAAAALGVKRACGLATLGLFADVPVAFPPRAGAIAVPEGPGLGLPS